MLPATAMLMLPGINLSWKSAWSKVRRGEDTALWGSQSSSRSSSFRSTRASSPATSCPWVVPLAILTGVMLADWLKGKFDQPVVGRDAFGHRPTNPAEVRGALLVISLAVAIIAACAFRLPMSTVHTRHGQRHNRI